MKKSETPIHPQVIAIEIQNQKHQGPQVIAIAVKSIHRSRQALVEHQDRLSVFMEQLDRFQTVQRHLVAASVSTEESLAGGARGVPLRGDLCFATRNLWTAMGFSRNKLAP